MQQLEICVKQNNARLFLNLITIHPFCGRNGRLCRINLAVALKLRGNVPVSIALSSGHKRGRKHYLCFKDG